MDVVVAGGKIHTVSFGSSEKALLVIHGGPDWDHSYLVSAVEKLSINRKVILFDIRGCGKSSKFEDESEYTVDNIVGDIKRIMEVYDIARCDVLGFSFGGVVAMHFADQYPDFVSSLILASTTSFPDYQGDLEALPEFLERNTPEIQDIISHSFFEAAAIGEEPSRGMALQTLSLDIYNLEKLAYIKPIIKRVTFSSEWIKAFRGGFVKTKSLDAAIVLEKLNSDVLIIHGEKDFRFPVSVAVRLSEMLPLASLVTIPNAGHLVHLEKTDEWASEIVKFLS